MDPTATSKEPVGVLTYEDVMLPLLLCAEDGKPQRVRDLAGKVADYFSVSEALRRETLPDGHNRLIHRMEWARTYLKQAGLVDYPGRGLFKITERGLSVLREKAGRIDSKFLRRYPEFVQFKSSEAQDGGAAGSSGAQPIDPEEAMERRWVSMLSTSRPNDGPTSQVGGGTFSNSWGCCKESARESPSLRRFSRKRPETM